MGTTPGDGVRVGPGCESRGAELPAEELQHMFDIGLREGFVTPQVTPVDSWFRVEVLIDEDYREPWVINHGQPLKESVVTELVKGVVGDQLFEKRLTEPAIAMPEWLTTVTLVQKGDKADQHHFKIDHDKLRNARKIMECFCKGSEPPPEIVAALQQAPTQTVAAIIRGLSPGTLLCSDIMRDVLQGAQNIILSQATTRNGG